MTCRAYQVWTWAFIALLALWQPTDGYASVVIAVDIGDGNVESGFRPFPVGAEETTGVAISHTYGGITVTVDELNSHAWRARVRNPIPLNGTFTQSDLLYDLMVSADGGFDIAATVSGLNPGKNYQVELWSYDAVTPHGTSDWTANGILVREDYSYNHGLPLSNDDYRILFTSIADSSGTIQIIGATSVASDGVRLNGLRISDAANAVPEPASLTLIGLGALGLVVRRRQLRLQFAGD